MGIRKRIPLQPEMNFAANILNEYDDPKIKYLSLFFIYKSGARVDLKLPTSRALQLRDKLNELYPPE